jgi:hypothetical protein
MNSSNAGAASYATVKRGDSACGAQSALAADVPIISDLAVSMMCDYQSRAAKGRTQTEVISRRPDLLSLETKKFSYFNMLDTSGAAIHSGTSRRAGRQTGQGNSSNGNEDSKWVEGRASALWTVQRAREFCERGGN